MEYVIVNRAEKTILCEGGTFERKRVGDHHNLRSEQDKKSNNADF